MAIKTGSVLERLCAAVDKHRNRVDRFQARVEELREEYRRAPIPQQAQVARRGFAAKRALERAQTDLQAAELALATEEKRLLQPDSFLRFA